MSYDLYLLHVPAGKDTLAEAESIVNQDIEEINLGLPDPETEAKKKVLAKELQAV